jgi:hypothetical protein
LLERGVPVIVGAELVVVAGADAVDVTDEGEVGR